MGTTFATWLLAFPILGFATGMRTMTPIAVLCWFAYLKFLPMGGTWGFWTASLVSAIIFTVLAFGEYIGDKLPKTPNRTDLFPLIGRLTFGGLVGALAATGVQGPLLEGILLGVLGAAAGTFTSFMLRRFFTHHCGRDVLVALFEDGIAIFFSLLALHSIST